MGIEDSHSSFNVSLAIDPIANPQKCTQKGKKVPASLWGDYQREAGTFRGFWKAFREIYLKSGLILQFVFLTFLQRGPETG